MSLYNQADVTRFSLSRKYLCHWKIASLQIAVHGKRRCSISGLWGPKRRQGTAESNSSRLNATRALYTFHSPAAAQQHINSMEPLMSDILHWERDGDALSAAGVRARPLIIMTHALALSAIQKRVRELGEEKRCHELIQVLCVLP